MAAIVIEGATFAGVAAAVRLARVGHRVTLVTGGDDWPDALAAQLGPTLVFPAPWRDLFTKSGRPAAGALGLHGLTLAPDAAGFPTDRGEQWHHNVAHYGPEVAARWRDLVDAAARTWLALRPLGLEAELTPDAVARAGLDPRRSVEDVAVTFGDHPLAGRIRAVAAPNGVAPADAPSWLVSRLAVERIFGRWRLEGPDGRAAPADRLVDVLRDRLTERGVTLLADGVPVADGVRPAEARIDARDPGVRWHRPRRLRRRDSFVDQLVARPPIADPTRPGRFAASASSAAGAEPWAQLLSGALATYAVHEYLTGEDIRPTNRAARR